MKSGSRGASVCMPAEGTGISSWQCRNGVCLLFEQAGRSLALQRHRLRSLWSQWVQLGAWNLKHNIAVSQQTALDCPCDG